MGCEKHDHDDESYLSDEICVPVDVEGYVIAWVRLRAEAKAYTPMTSAVAEATASVQSIRLEHLGDCLGEES